MYKVILVDDEPLMLEDLKEIIDWNEAGFEIVATFKNGEEMLAFLKLCEVDLIITDIKMPGMTGIDICEVVKKKRDIPIILISAYSDFEYARKAIYAGAFEYLTKPVKPEELLLTLKRVTEKIKENRQRSRIFIKSKIHDLINECHSESAIIADISKAFIGRRKSFISAVIRANKHLNVSATEDALLPFQAYVTPIGNLKYLCLFVLYGNEKVEKLSEFLHSYAKKDKICIGRSEVFQNLKELLTSIEQADMMVEKIFTNDSGVYVYEKHDIVDLLTLIKTLSSHNEISTFINEFTKTIQNKSLNPNEIYLIYKAIVEKLSQRGIETKEIKNYKYLVESFNSMSDMQNYLLEFLEENKKEENISAKKIIKNIVEYISVNYNKKLYMGEFAEKYFLSAKYLSVLFKNEVGKPFIEYLVETRLNKAMELLENEELSINEISEMVGYDDYFHFSRLFKKYKGDSPSRYRANLKQNKYD